jgi:hypothetical protein
MSCPIGHDSYPLFKARVILGGILSTLALSGLDT